MRGMWDEQDRSDWRAVGFQPGCGSCYGVETRVKGRKIYVGVAIRMLASHAQ